MSATPDRSPGTPWHCRTWYETGQAIWFGGGKLAPDLTLPQLHRRWQGHEPSMEPQAEQAGRAGRPRGAGDGTPSGLGADRFGLTPQERLRLWHGAQDATARATAQITATLDVGADPRLAGDVAWATSDLLAVVARLTERRAGGPYTEAARAFEHAGRDLHHTPHVRTPAGRRLRTATTALSAVRVALPSEVRELLLLGQRLIALAEAVARLRQTQARAAQAAAAREAAYQLRALQPRPVVPAPVAGLPLVRPVSVHNAATTTPRRGR